VSSMFAHRMLEAPPGPPDTSDPSTSTLVEILAAFVERTSVPTVFASSEAGSSVAMYNRLMFPIPDDRFRRLVCQVRHRKVLLH